MTARFNLKIGNRAAGMDSHWSVGFTTYKLHQVLPYAQTNNTTSTFIYKAIYQAIKHRIFSILDMLGY